MGDAKVAYVKMQAEVATNQVVTHPCMCFTTHDKKTTRWTIIGGIFIGILVAATILGIWYVFAYTSPANLGGNILYSTFHGGTQSICNYKEENVIAFSESGTLIGPVLEAGDGTRAGQLKELRGMLLFANHLYVVNSFRDDSRVVIFGPRNKTSGHHPFVSNFTRSSGNNSALSHPYGIARDRAGNIYISSQNSGTVTRYKGCQDPGRSTCEDGTAPGTPLDLAGGHGCSAVSYPGCFIKLTGTGIRGIAFDDDGLLYVANQDDPTISNNGVFIFDQAGQQVGQVNVTGAIGLFFDNRTQRLLIGCNQHGSKDRVVAYDVAQKKLVQQYGAQQLEHPAGIAVSGDVVFVNSQQRNTVLGWNVRSSTYLGQTVEVTCRTPEHLIAIAP